MYYTLDITRYMLFPFQTIIHLLAVMGSLGVFFGFCLIYNVVCVNCMGLLCSYWVMEMAIMRYTYWLTVLLTCVLALMPKYVVVSYILTVNKYSKN